jgi:hypothetical protein
MGLERHTPDGLKEWQDGLGTDENGKLWLGRIGWAWIAMAHTGCFKGSAATDSMGTAENGSEAQRSKSWNGSKGKA